MELLNAGWETKALKDDGSFVGHAGVFGNVDLGGDVIESGAFKEIVTNHTGKSVVLWQHRTDTPIASAIFTPDSKGLKVEGQLVLEDPMAKAAYAHLKAGSVSGMSFGYDILPGGAEYDEKKRTRKLTALKVWEASVVTFGMNPRAGVEQVKAIGKCVSVREFEDFLRDVGGFSGTQAKALASGGWGALKATRDGDLNGEQQDAIIRAQFASILSLHR